MPDKVLKIVEKQWVKQVLWRSTWFSFVVSLLVPTLVTVLIAYFS